MAEVALVRASVVCYHCGHATGEVEATVGAPLATGALLPAGRPGVRVPIKGRSVRCPRCGGPTYYEDARPVRQRQPRVVAWRGRGRPPKEAVRIVVPAPDGAPPAGARPSSTRS